jgi:hypothetical protein
MHCQASPHPTKLKPTASGPCHDPSSGIAHSHAAFHSPILHQPSLLGERKKIVRQVRLVDDGGVRDLIYSAVLPVPKALPAIDKTAVATAIPIQEVYGTPEVQNAIGTDVFVRLIPLSVHESASVYLEEKAKLVRGEDDRMRQKAGSEVL